MFRVLLSLVMLAFVGGVLNAQEKHTTDTLDTVKKNVAEGKAILLDVRGEQEWEAGHLKDAKLVPVASIKEIEGKATEVKGIAKDKIVYTHCKAGGRALKAAETLKKMGYDVRALKPGYEELLKAGFEQAK